MKDQNRLNIFAPLALAVLLIIGMTGCEIDRRSSGGESSGDDPSDFLGTWQIVDQSAGADNRPWYVVFQDDGTWYFSDAPDSGPDESGVKNYVVDGGILIGAFTNPNVGDGRIEASVTGNNLSLSFIEYWSTPEKIIPYAGTRL